MHTLQIDGHRYSVDHTAPRLVLMSVIATTQRALLTGTDAGPIGVEQDFVTVLDDQQAKVHRLTAGACACGLVIDDIRVLGGHRDLGNVEIAKTFVVGDHGGWWAMACQACRVVSDCLDEAEARDLVRQHRCDWDLEKL